jgi:hypothetical protein
MAYWPARQFTNQVHVITHPERKFRGRYAAVPYHGNLPRDARRQTDIGRIESDSERSKPTPMLRSQLCADGRSLTTLIEALQSSGKTGE